MCNILHLFSDTVIFDLVTHNRSLLSCQVNVSADPGFVLSILYNGHKIRSGKPECWEMGCNLSVTILLTHGGKYECRLYLNKNLITKMVSDYILHGNIINSHMQCWLSNNGLMGNTVDYSEQ